MLSSSSSSLKQSGLTPGFGNLKHEQLEASTSMKYTPTSSTKVKGSRFQHPSNSCSLLLICPAHNSLPELKCGREQRPPSRICWSHAQRRHQGSGVFLQHDNTKLGQKVHQQKSGTTVLQKSNFYGWIYMVDFPPELQKHSSSGEGEKSSMKTHGCQNTPPPCLPPSSMQPELGELEGELADMLHPTEKENRNSSGARQCLWGGRQNAELMGAVCSNKGSHHRSMCWLDRSKCSHLTWLWQLKWELCYPQK